MSELSSWSLNQEDLVLDIWGKGKFDVLREISPTVWDKKHQHAEQAGAYN